MGKRKREYNYERKFTEMSKRRERRGKGKTRKASKGGEEEIGEEMAKIGNGEDDKGEAVGRRG